ncbi:mitochondrial triosephosphate isomerase [Hypoxylon fragiforme]|uniref:mitochondrial triosephosphate isomerase n=1 Tax=Hypoxylon fragiforme TaxID=63214 RepID=UPI0020C64A79|nr:mitochondrial triosephosphate isomerase [Hypoxylon fragiforme]KAI2605731.1 mitochondrial triosephosphate isomerase [Hypoxylon fragiforme]
MASSSSSSSPSLSSPPPRRRLIGVSTKMYFSASRTSAYVRSLLSILSSPHPPGPPLLSALDIFIIPDHVTLSSVVDQLRSHSHSHNHPDTVLLAGAQDAHHADAGAYTGCVSPAVLAEVGCRILEIGHAERRRLFGETDHDAALKAVAAVRNRMIPLICIGERTRAGGDSRSSSDEDGYSDEAAAQTAMAEVAPQVSAVLSHPDLPPTAEVILAYEPVWAIGAPSPAPASHVVAVARRIRELECVRGRQGGATTRILYGGSAGPGLFAKLKDGGVDGLFLGRFAHDPEEFYRTIVEVATA